ncbi:MAG: hypothetical protein V4439_01540 [Patescibacteria group bacterium]
MRLIIIAGFMLAIGFIWLRFLGTDEITLTHALGMSVVIPLIPMMFFFLGKIDFLKKWFDEIFGPQALSRDD